MDFCLLIHKFLHNFVYIIRRLYVGKNKRKKFYVNFPLNKNTKNTKKSIILTFSMLFLRKKKKKKTKIFIIIENVDKTSTLIV